MDSSPSLEDVLLQWKISVRNVSKSLIFLWWRWWITMMMMTVMMIDIIITNILLYTFSSQRDNMDHSRPLSPPRSRDYSRRDDRSSSSNGTSNNTKSSNRSSNVPSNESWAAERRKRQQIPLSSGSVRYAGHKDIKLTLNKVCSLTISRWERDGT